MLIVHGTAAFRDRVPGLPADGAASTTALGDWSVNVLRWRKPVAVFMNERTLLPVLLPLAPAKTLLARLPDAAADVMAALDIPSEFIAAEVAAMREARLEPTTNRSLVASLTDMSKSLTWRRGPGEPNLLELALWLADRPSARLDYRRPAAELRAIVQHLGHPTSRVVRERPPAAKRTRPVPPIPTFPTSFTAPGGQRIEVRHKPGQSDQLLQELKPLLLPTASTSTTRTTHPAPRPFRRRWPEQSSAATWSCSPRSARAAPPRPEP